MKKLMILLAVLGSSIVVHADEQGYVPQWEVIGSSSSGVVYQGSSGNYNESGSISGAAGYLYGQTGFELLASPSISLISFSGSSVQTVITFTLAPEYNFTPDHFADSWYVFVGPGLSYVNNSSFSSTNFVAVAGVGKRVQLFQHISWSPQIAYTAFVQTPYASNVSLSLLSFSLNF